MARQEKFSSNYRNTETPNFKKSLEERNKKLEKFPIDTYVFWKHDPGPILKVTGHDTKYGRIEVNNGRSYLSDELEFYIEE